MSTPSALTWTEVSEVDKIFLERLKCLYRVQQEWAPSSKSQINIEPGQRSQFLLNFYPVGPMEEPVLFSESNF